MNYQGIKLAEGYVPSKPGEIIIDSTMARNLKLTIGDKISGFDYTITGIAKSKYYFACAVDDYSTWNPGLLILSNGKHKDYLSLCKQLGYPPNKIRLDDYINGKQDFLTNIVEILVLSKNLITILSSILLSICIIVVFHMYIHDRHEEWCLYHSIGFSIKDVFLLANRELLLSFSLAVLFASAVSTVFVILLKLLLIIPMGIMCTPFIPSEMLNILCILIMLFGILQIPLSFAMHRIKTIDAISEEAI
jgi:ABC-type antimicrobial peptide transport system permease subunit